MITVSIIIVLVLSLVIIFSALYYRRGMELNRITIKYHARVTNQYTDEDIEVREAKANELKETRKKS